MNNQRATGLVVALLGLLLTCCICPLVLNSVVVVGSGGRDSLYISLLGGPANATLTSYVITLQYLCLALFALIVLVVGIVLFVRSGQRTASVTPLDRY